MGRKRFAIIASLSCLWTGTVAAEFFSDTALAVDSSSLDDSAAALYGTACEKIKPQEAKSSVRLRATDKASFEAVKGLSELSEFKSKTSEHDFNVLVYGIVDNYVEDLAVRTTKQDNIEICVEITGYVKKSDLTSAMLQNDENAPEETAAHELNNDEMRQEADEQANEVPQQKMPEPASIPSEQTASGRPSAFQQKEAAQTAVPQKLLYIAPVAFFNNTVSETHKQTLKEIFGKNEDFYITDNKDTADYIVSAKIMRAKVDPINSNTNRLQMVLSVGVEFADSGASTVEHQNRFILFSSEDNEQEVAAKLMRKLLSKAGEQILNKVEEDIRRSAKNAGTEKIITPK